MLTDGTPGSGNEKRPPVLPLGAIASPFLAVFVNDMLSTILITHTRPSAASRSAVRRRRGGAGNGSPVFRRRPEREGTAVRHGRPSDATVLDPSGGIARTEQPAVGHDFRRDELSISKHSRHGTHGRTAGKGDSVCATIDGKRPATGTGAIRRRDAVTDAASGQPRDVAWLSMPICRRRVRWMNGQRNGIMPKRRGAATEAINTERSP